MHRAMTLTRRAFVAGLAATPALGRLSLRAAQAAVLPFSYPIGVPGKIAGDGFFIRIGYACENAAYYPGWWHTGENWRAVAGDTFGAEVYAVADGVVAFADSDYPGRVVIVRHAADLYSMYGHLDYALDVAVGQQVTRGQRLGTVLRRSDEPGRSHLHFELRAFYIRDDVNGTSPQYGVHCGYECPPGPGYWPMNAPAHPSDLGWRNPTHVIARRAFSAGVAPSGTEAIVPRAADASTRVYSEPVGESSSQPTGELALAPGDHHPLLEIRAGPEDDRGTSAEAYSLWYRLALPDGGSGWVQATVPSNVEVGSDGRSAAVGFNLMPVVTDG
ncbi:MAG TPA: M23 family metallopeptidase [Thermomicrobiales bacterium]|nr:M23 family metallopeptidase [Thermomicrobiales bacterium]